MFISSYIIYSHNRRKCKLPYGLHPAAEILETRTLFSVGFIRVMSTHHWLLRAPPKRAQHVELETLFMISDF